MGSFAAARVPASLALLLIVALLDIGFRPPQAVTAITAFSIENT
jgi:hypothetical protein